MEPEPKTRECVDDLDQEKRKVAQRSMVSRSMILISRPL
jgi:hypothetical protein